MSEKRKHLPAPLDIPVNEEFRLRVGKITFKVKPTEEGINVDEDIASNAQAFPDLFGGDYAGITRHLGGITLKPGETLRVGRAVGNIGRAVGQVSGIEVLDVQGEPDTEREFWLAASSLNEAFRSDSTVSRQHVEMKVMDNGQIRIQDLGSANGTQVVQ